MHIDHCYKCTHYPYLCPASPYPDHPLIRVGVPKVVSGLAVFAFSATMHEVILSLPFKYVALHAFNGMVRCDVICVYQYDCQSVVDTHCLSMDIDCLFSL